MRSFYRGPSLLQRDWSRWRDDPPLPPREERAAIDPMVTRFHEAGHTVVAWASGRDCHRVRASADGDSGEFQQFEESAWLSDPQNRQAFRDAVLDSLSSDDRWKMFPEAVLLCAGRAATRRLVGRSADHLANHDIEQAQSIAHSVSDSSAERSAFLLLAEGEAARLVDQHWGQVTAIAEALSARGVLERHEIAALLSGAGAGVQRSPERAPQPGPEQYFERRGGVTLPSTNRDSDRRVAVFARRCDGYIA
jgi:hypothetical protein